MYRRALEIKACYFLIQNLKKYVVKHSETLKYCKYPLQYSSLLTVLKELVQFKEKPERHNKYWLYSNDNEVIKEADKLFSEGKYLEVYELLNRLKYNDNIEMQWRVCRALYKMSKNEEISQSVRNEMIIEGYNLICTTIDSMPHNANIHKWMAILLDAKAGIEGTAKRIAESENVKYHLMLANELNPDDSNVLYLLGYWCYRIASLTWFQKQIAKIFFSEPPKATYEEAFNFFLKAEEAHPRFYLPNLYMLGKTCIAMKRYYRANYYLTFATTLPPRTQAEVECQKRAKLLLESISAFDITSFVLYDMS